MTAHSPHFPHPSKSDSLILLARPPVPGRVKTRLIPALGEDGAALLYEAFLADAAGVARAARRARVSVSLSAEWALGEETQGGQFIGGAPPFGEWLPGPFLHRAQTGADLGARMAAAMGRRLAWGGSAVLMGTDLPDLPPEIPLEAFSALERMGKNGAVLGPAADGGYYLIGLGRPAADSFTGHVWGSGRVLETTRNALAAQGFSVHLLPEWRDVDGPDDLAALKARLAAAPATTAPHTRAALIE